jgi:hypothetical protein
MDWQFYVALVVAIPLILFPAAFIWYLNVSGIYRVLKNTLTRKSSRPEQRREQRNQR